MRPVVEGRVTLPFQTIDEILLVTLNPPFLVDLAHTAHILEQPE